jgi:hypothetical protein
VFPEQKIIDVMIFYFRPVVPAQLKSSIAATIIIVTQMMIVIYTDVAIASSF